MYIKKLKRKCGVRGCKCTDTFAISKTRELGNSIIICKSCLGGALSVIDDIDPLTQNNIPKTREAVPTLFFNAVAQGITNGNDTITEENNNNTETHAEAKETGDENTESDIVKQYICPQCGKEFKSESGLKSHIKACKGQKDKNDN